MTKDIAFTNLAVFPKAIQKFKFEQLQKLAFSKGIGWVDTSMNYERQMTIPSIYIQFAGDLRNGKLQYIMYSSNAKELSYRDMIKKLRALK